MSKVRQVKSKKVRSSHNADYVNYGYGVAKTYTVFTWHFPILSRAAMTRLSRVLDGAKTKHVSVLGWDIASEIGISLGVSFGSSPSTFQSSSMNTNFSEALAIVSSNGWTSRAARFVQSASGRNAR